MKRQLFDRVNWGNLGMLGGKIVLNADDYDFELEISKLTVDASTSKKTFIDPVIIPIKKEEINEFAKGVIEPFIMFYNRVKFKIREIPEQHVFADIKFITRGMHAIRLVGEFVTDNGMKNRKTVLSVYKLNSWDEVKAFNKDATQFEGQAIANYQFEHMGSSRGSFVYKDIVALDELQEVISDAFYKRSASYTSFLEDVAKEKGASGFSKPAELGQPVNTTFKPVSIPNDDSDGFPF